MKYQVLFYQKNNVSFVYQHYPFTLGLGFLCLHQRPMIDSIFLQEKPPSKLGLFLLGNQYITLEVVFIWKK